MTTQQPEAIKLAERCEHGYPLTGDAISAAAELRRQHARITELESQLAQRFDAADMATASAQGFRDGVASVSAGSESVAPPPLQLFESPRAKILMRAWQEGWDACRDAEYVGEDAQNDAFNQSSTVNHCVAEDILYTHPSPKEGMAGWTTLPGQMPEPNTPVLLDIGKKFTIRALWAEKHTVRVGTDVDDWGEYDEETDEYYCPEGWYEWNEHEEVHWAVSETPRAWRELPQPIPAAPGPADGESNG